MFKAIECLFSALVQAFRTPRFRAGERVNLMRTGALARWDGRVIAQAPRGVLVEWPRAGQSWEDPHRLCAQVG